MAFSTANIHTQRCPVSYPHLLPPSPFPAFVPTSPPSCIPPSQLFLGRLVGEGGRDLIARYSLKQRQFIGSTSMDAQLAFIMTNMAQLGPGSVMLDPFVGSGEQRSLEKNSQYSGLHVEVDEGSRTL